MSRGADASGATVLDLYRAVWRVTARQQLALIALSLSIALLAAAPLKLQQLIVNNLAYRGDLQRLSLLCVGFLCVVLLSAALKFALNMRQAVLGERVVLLIRERVYANYVSDVTARTPVAPTRGTIVTMISAEAESVGAFAGAAVAAPLMQLGTLASIIAFMLASQPWLGLVALGVVLPQAAIVVAIQARINRRLRERVQALRDASDRISESALARVEDQVVADFRDAFAARRRIFLLKLSAKFALGAISAAGAVGILFLGGWLVIQGRSDVGTVVASLTGLTRLEAPWRELISFFRSVSAVRVKYAMLLPALTERRPGAPAGGTPMRANPAAGG